MAQDPVGKLLEGAALRSFEELSVLDPARIHTAPAHAHVTPIAADDLQHAPEVVVTLRRGLPALRARRGIPQEEDAGG